MYRSLPMRLKGKAAVPMSRKRRIAMVAIGVALFFISVLLALGLVE